MPLRKEDLSLNEDGAVVVAKGRTFTKSQTISILSVASGNVVGDPDGSVDDGMHDDHILSEFGF